MFNQFDDFINEAFQSSQELQDKTLAEIDDVASRFKNRELKEFFDEYLKRAKKLLKRSRNKQDKDQIIKLFKERWKSLVNSRTEHLDRKLKTIKKKT